MVELKRTDLSVRAERAILLHIVLHKDKNDEDSLAELKRLAKTAGAKVLDSVVQRRRKIDPSFYLGKGKVSQLAELCKDKEIDVVICDADLTPAQVSNLENAIDTKVIDRSELILDIFAVKGKNSSGKTASRTGTIRIHKTAPEEDVVSPFQDRGRHRNQGSR